ncbi:alpha/beta hydrolase fold protein [Cellulomonas flavigena DSM 20109]|uniref:Alpha/beta hydrolase fold protein n=1 Tax=Cellulomonas flavigena (strain ATCC 482 / DSM 20109 / BCRC 11376 / JCM 18109 / NBRC 3775 / NCIMB 8073 / NRS 134) TaxID=446466 RepID=D5UBV1_CELFN|nr:alpha/beta fold hydrolase [Cellulomonas flavigena]ADG74196.1 alpha/beta hydrolase fold protein [Cellulomonas flavigena DSM 20109]
MTLLLREPARPGTDPHVARLRVDGLPLRTSTYAADERVATGRPFVLVHGLGASSVTFADLAQHLRRHGTVHALDLPGFGRVPRPAEPLGMGDLGRLVARWAERTGVHDAVLVGHSMGTQVVTEVLATSPVTASHAVLLGPTVDDTAATVARQLVRLAASCATEPPHVLAQLARTTLECGPRWYTAELTRMLDHDVLGLLRRAGAPVLVVRGSRDRVAPAGWVERLARVAPRGRAATLPGAAHNTMQSHAREVAALVLEHAGMLSAEQRSTGPSPTDPPRDGPGQEPAEHGVP